MTNVVAHDVFHEQTRQQDTDHRIEQVEVVGTSRIEIARQQMLDKVNQLFQDNRRRRGADTDQKTDDQYKMLFLDVLLPPEEKAIEKTNFCYCLNAT